MEEIDWSKEPEATHFYKGCNDWMPQWIKSVNGKRYYKIIGSLHWTVDEIPLPLNQCIPRPTHTQPTWNGEGLPPVGTVCEWLCGQYGWLGGKVVGHDGTVTVVAHNDGYTGCHPHEIRPIRTPEQIAAEEREKAIDEMVYGDCEYGPDDRTTTARIVCGLLYDAGYRKVKP